ncbi:MAG: hypothetical protein QNL91_05135 [Candidatus Krumholzibacteria bacterium]|nr:hypothetical protein [Candidatus Krumholzibacteria bacterium]
MTGRANRLGLNSGLMLGLALTVLVLSGCGEGEDIPLLAPGGTSVWPADPGWNLRPALLNGEWVSDGLWSRQDVAGSPRVVLVGSRGTVLEYTDGQWQTVSAGGNTFSTVVELQPGEFVANGELGLAMRREGGVWVSEDTGTEMTLLKSIARDGEVWAVGSEGTVCRRAAGLWTTLPTAGESSLIDVAVLNDSLFVVTNRGDVRIWANESWSDMPGGPWLAAADSNFGEQGVLGLATVGDGRLYAVTDSLYVREPNGWRTISDWAHNNWSRLETRVIGQTLWYGNYAGWWRIDPTVAAWQPQRRLLVSAEIMAIRDDTNFLASASNGSMNWVEDGVVRQETAGRLGVHGHIALAEGGMYLMADVGVVQRRDSGVQVVLAEAEIPLASRYGFEVGCGLGPQDYYLIGHKALYHCVDGVPTLLGTWEDDWHSVTGAVATNGELYLGTSKGLMQWQGGTWQQVLPRLGTENWEFAVWPLGDGRLGAGDTNGELYYLQDGQWNSLGMMGRDVVQLCGEDGTLFVIREDHEYDSNGNSLLVYDDRAGAFRDLGQQGMGPLKDLPIAGASSRNGEVLIWTQNPTMVFALSGSPASADWQVVAGPLDEDIQWLERLPSGNLLAWVNDVREFAVYQP